VSALGICNEKWIKIIKLYYILYFTILPSVLVRPILPCLFTNDRPV